VSKEKKEKEFLFVLPKNDDQRWSQLLRNLPEEARIRIVGVSSLRKKDLLELPDYSDALTLNSNIGGKDGTHSGVGRL
jgi:hypothetical protein